jgi:hypothetical protein
VVAEKFAADTREPREQLRAALPQPGQGMGMGGGGGGGGDMQAMRARMEQLMPLVMKLVEDDRKAVDEAMKQLNDGQKEKARQFIEERNRPRRPGSF